MTMQSHKRRRIILGIAGLAAAALLFVGAKQIIFSLHHEVTEDAQIDGHVHPVLPRVSGYVSDLYVIENQFVKKNDLLLKIDSRDYKVRVDQARAALANAEATLMVARANVSSAGTARTKTALDLKRDRRLRSGDVIAQSQLDATQAQADSAEAQYSAAVSQVAVAQSQVAMRRAELEGAELQFSYTEIRAPSAGKVTRKSVEAGQLVQAGQPLLTVVEGDDIWVTANFKETQLTRMHQGQKAHIAIDVYPRSEFEGTIQSISAGTGARFALLPADNATGNFVKVVQRVPVKVLFTKMPDASHPIGVGMNAVVTIDVD